jgi:hypothetical protein
MTADPLIVDVALRNVNVIGDGFDPLTVTRSG